MSIQYTPPDFNKEQYDPEMRYDESTKCPKCKIHHIDIPCPDESILQEAERLVGGDRQWAYDTPLNNCTRIGKIWGVILGTDPVPPETVGLMMCGLKIAREVHRHSRDNLVDLAGYAHVTHQCIEANET